MFAHTAAKRRFANVAGSVTLHPDVLRKGAMNIKRNCLPLLRT